PTKTPTNRRPSPKRTERPMTSSFESPWPADGGRYDSPSKTTRSGNWPAQSRSRQLLYALDLPLGVSLRLASNRDLPISQSVDPIVSQLQRRVEVDTGRGASCNQLLAPVTWRNGASRGGCCHFFRKSDAREKSCESDGKVLAEQGFDRANVFLLLSIDQ